MGGYEKQGGGSPNKDVVGSRTGTGLHISKSTWIRLSRSVCRSFAARSAATLGNDLVGVEVQGSDPRSRRQRPGIEEEYKEDPI